MRVIITKLGLAHCHAENVLLRHCAVNRGRLHTGWRFVLHPDHVEFLARDAAETITPPLKLPNNLKE